MNVKPDSVIESRNRETDWSNHRSARYIIKEREQVTLEYNTHMRT